MSKYIIRNCPAFVLMRTATSGTYFDMCGNAKGHIECADRTDCLFKQIYEICKNNALIGGIDETAEKVVDLLDIQECGND